MNGKIIKAVGGIFYVKVSDIIYPCTARKKLRYGENELAVGDSVDIALNDGKGTIENVCLRINLLARPAVANIDAAIITVASVPAADLLLVDKIIINCLKQNIAPIIAINKSDIDDGGILKTVKKDYGSFVECIIPVSALTGMNVDDLKTRLLNRTSVLCGQSAAGKTSLLNAITGGQKETGGISVKSGRGKHTTRHTEIFEFKAGSFIVDTPGFSLLELEGVESCGLYSYFPDMMSLKDNCKFSNCTHTSEPDCAVRLAVENKVLSGGRYERYVKLFNELKHKEKIKY